MFRLKYVFLPDFNFLLLPLLKFKQHQRAKTQMQAVMHFCNCECHLLLYYLVLHLK